MTRFHDLGFPAHAGMDPCTQPTLPVSVRFPRTRGDGPFATARCHADRSVSPHTRGWTSAVAVPPVDHGGFPAHAGMDHVDQTSPVMRSRFPRTRGDGPRPCLFHQSIMAVSPHTRGWTLLRAARAREARGFPAHAGMDPRRATRRRTARWFPRTRGDGPAQVDVRADRILVSPHTRGWTPLPPSVVRELHGFPAHAGMDRGCSPSRRAPDGFPRTRGDGPARWLDFSHDGMVSPHTRGWTASTPLGADRRVGFPAHAGMDPSPLEMRPATPWFPRTRGDGPEGGRARSRPSPVSPHTRGWTRIEARVHADRGGFPAHAGMDPSSRRSPSFSRRFPRTRGDGPRPVLFHQSIMAVSPHTRGWTRTSAERLRCQRGFPAHAGMDRRVSSSANARARFPRTRGDGPYRRATAARP